MGTHEKAGFICQHDVLVLALYDQIGKGHIG